MEDDEHSEFGVCRRGLLAMLGAAMATSAAGCAGAENATPTAAGDQDRSPDRRTTPTTTARRRSRGSDIEHFNAMGYTGADDLIFEAAAVMDPQKRQPLVRKILAQIWHDAPTNVTWEDIVLQPVNTAWEGWVKSLGGVLNTDTFLNLRRRDGSEGGKPVVGMDDAPDSLNPLAARSSHSFQIIDQVYGYGLTTDPETLSILPWSVASWSLDEENVGTASPTVVAELRDDMTFNDGVGVTAEDVKFTVEYIAEQQPGGSYNSSAFDLVEEVTVDTPGGTTVNYFFSEPTADWLTSILGAIILPAHIWRNISDYTQYTLHDSPEGLIGHGPFVLSDFNWQRGFDLELRPTDELWQNTATVAEWLDDDGPFLAGIRFDIFDSKAQMIGAALDGAVDVTYDTWSVTNALKAKNTDFLTVIESPDDAFQHHSFNLRRVPFDDIAFRQFLIKTLDNRWVIDELFHGIAAVEGTYVTPSIFEEWRPSEPDAADTYEGIALPTLEFPGRAGSFALNEEEIAEARNFLINHPDAKHDYSLGEAISGLTNAPDGQEIYVNGESLEDAHTNNFGDPVQGPLEMSFNPPQEGVEEAHLAQRWIGLLNTIGVPTEPNVQPFNSQFTKIFVDEDFDMFAVGWAVGVSNTHYRRLYSSAGADLEY